MNGWKDFEIRIRIVYFALEYGLSTQINLYECRGLADVSDMKQDSAENQRRILFINLIFNSKPRLEKQGTGVLDGITS